MTAPAAPRPSFVPLTQGDLDKGLSPAQLLTSRKRLLTKRKRLIMTTKSTKTAATPKRAARPAPKPTTPAPAPIRTVRTAAHPIRPAPKPTPSAPDTLARLKSQCGILYSKEDARFTMDVGLYRLPPDIRGLSLPKIALWIADNLPVGWHLSSIRRGSDYAEHNATAEVSFRAYARIESED